MNLIVHVPHASTLVPDELRDQFGISSTELAEEAKVSADLYTDLLAQAAWPNAEIIDAQISRVVVDVERYPEDNLEATAGQVLSHRRNRNALSSAGPQWPADRTSNHLNLRGDLVAPSRVSAWLC